MTNPIAKVGNRITSLLNILPPLQPPLSEPLVSRHRRPRLSLSSEWKRVYGRASRDRTRSKIINSMKFNEITRASCTSVYTTFLPGNSTALSRGTEIPCSLVWKILDTYTGWWNSLIKSWRLIDEDMDQNLSLTDFYDVSAYSVIPNRWIAKSFLRGRHGFF